MRLIECDVCKRRTNIEAELTTIEVVLTSTDIATTTFDVCSPACLEQLAKLMDGYDLWEPEEEPEPEPEPEPVPERVIPPVSQNDHFIPLDEDMVEQVTGVVRRGRRSE